MQKWQQWEAASEADWGIAVEREAIIRLLAGRDQLSTCDVDEAIIRLRISRSVLYKLLRRYRQRPQTSSLLPWKRGRDNSLAVAIHWRIRFPARVLHGDASRMHFAPYASRPTKAIRFVRDLRTVMPSLSAI